MRSASSAAAMRPAVTGGHGAVLEVGAVEAVQLPQAAEVDRRPCSGDVVGSRARARATSSSSISSLIVVGDLEAHRPAEPATAQLHLDRGEQVVGLLVLEREVGVAGDAERRRLLDHHADEQRVEVGGDQLLDRDEAARRRPRTAAGRRSAP